MAEVLVSLVSKQTIPNILLIKELTDIERYVFVTTAETEKNGWTDWIIRACGINESQYQRIRIPEDDPQLEAVFKEKLHFSDDDRFIVNLTGGTKMMSIGVYNFFARRQAKIIYLPFGKNHYVQVLPEIEHRIIPIDYRLSLPEYLASCNVHIVNPDKINALLYSDASTTRKFLENYLQCSSTELDVLDCLRDFRKNGVRFDSEKLEYSAEDLNTVLTKLNFKPENQEKLSRYEVRYLTGDWLEEYAYSLLKEKLRLDERAIGLGVNIQINDIPNEVDIFLVSNNAIHFIECKTGFFDHRSGKDILTETLYKVQALQRNFGLSIRSHLFTLTPQEQIREADLKRSKAFGINIFTREHLAAGDLGLLTALCKEKA